MKKTKNTLRTCKLEVLDLTNYRTKQIKSLKKGWEIYVCGTLCGNWEDEEWSNKNRTNKHWKYFYDTFKETDLFITAHNGIPDEEMWSRYNKIYTILMNTFNISYSKVIINDLEQ